MISSGDKLDLRFRVKMVCDGVVKEMAFADLLTRRTIVSVHMKNKTPSCDRQNDSLVGHAARLNLGGYDIVGISRDTPNSHLRYAVAKKISFPLVSDPHDQFAHAADSLVQKSMYGRTFIGPARAAFVLDHEGTVLAVMEKIDTANFGHQLEELIQTL